MKKHIEFIKSFNSLPLNVRVVGLAILILIFSTFRFISLQDRANLTNSLTSVLRSEYSSANSYAMSKAMADLESLHVIKCVTLTEKAELYRVFYDTSGNRDCVQLQFLKNIFYSRTDLTAINGLVYQLEYRIPISFSWIFLEAISYILIVISFWIYGQSWLRQQINNEIKIKVLAMEKEMVIDMAKQVRHDVASPIAALRAIVKMMSKVDPEIIEYLNRAVGRTEEIFNQLNQSTQEKTFELGSVAIESCLQEILTEKSIQWGSSCEVVFNSDDAMGKIVYANPIELKRILSNIFNNAYESLEVSRRRKISILVSKEGSDIYLKISDTGKGIPDEVLKKLGTKGLSSGKESHQTAGSGLGVYHAMNTLRSWGGDLSFKSAVGEGTETTIKLRSI